VQDRHLAVTGGEPLGVQQDRLVAEVIAGAGRCRARGIRQDVHHQVPVHLEPHVLQQRLQLLRAPVADRRARIHDPIQRVGEPPLVRRLAIHVLDEQTRTLGQRLGHLLEQRPHRVPGNVWTIVEHVGGVEALTAPIRHDVADLVSHVAEPQPSRGRARHLDAARLRSKPSTVSAGCALA